MKNTKVLITVSFVLFFIQAIFLFAPNFVKADLWSSQTGLGDEDQSIGEVFGGKHKDVREIVAYVIKVFLGFLGIIFLVLLLMAGFKWMTAAGDSTKTTEALKGIQHALIGIIIILMAYSLTQFVLDCGIRATTGYRGTLFCTEF